MSMPTAAVTIGGLGAIFEKEVTRLAQVEATRLVATELAAARSPWLNAGGAAGHMCCPVSRIRKLTAQGVLPHHREGGRVLYHRDDLDAYIRNGGAKCQ